MLRAIAELTNDADRDYLDQLYRTCYPMLKRLVSSIIQDRTDVDDVITNAMLSLFDKVPKLREMDETNRIAYLRATVRNAAYKYYNAHQKKSLTQLFDRDSIFSLPDAGQGDPADILLQRDEIRMLRRAIAALSLKDRQLLYLKYAVRLTAREIAEMTNAPREAAVHARLSRARRKVVSMLRGWEDEGE